MRKLAQTNTKILSSENIITHFFMIWYYLYGSGLAKFTWTSRFWANKTHSNKSMKSTKKMITNSTIALKKTLRKIKYGSKKEKEKTHSGFGFIRVLSLQMWAKGSYIKLLITIWAWVFGSGLFLYLKFLHIKPIYSNSNTKKKKN